MRLDELLKLDEHLAQNCREILHVANREYADDHDALDNFKLVARLTGQTPKEVCAVYMTKHFIGIMKAVQGNMNQRDSVEGRIVDCKNYLTLMAGLFVEEEGREREYNMKNVPSSAPKRVI